MNIGYATAIFMDIENPQFSIEDKAIAIDVVLNMETHNGITKASLLKVCKWLFDQHFEIKKRGNDDE